MRTVIYARFSSLLQNARSIEDQIALCRERCEREGWTVVDVFTDYAISGAAGIENDQRPGLNALLARVEDEHNPDGRIDQVLAEASDRIARHQGDAHAIRERITFAGARIFTLSDGELTDITATFRGLMDAQFRKDLAAKVKRGQRGTIASKRSAAGIAYGYRRVAKFDEKGEAILGLREIDPDQAQIVRRIFDEFAQGRSPRQIAARLNEDCVAPPQSRSGAASHWRASTIYGDRKRKNGILQNRLYIGQLVFGRTRRVADPRTRKTKIVANPESEWQIEDVPALRIVTDEQWTAVQGVLGQVQARRPEQSRRPKHLLSGLGRCGVCGGAWIVRGTRRWGCSRRLESGSAACSNSRTISNAEYEERVLQGLREQMLAPELVEIYVQEFRKEYARRSAEAGQNVAQLRRRHTKASEKVDRLVAVIADGGESFAEIREALTEARNERDRIARELGNSEQLPRIALHPDVARDYRAKVARLNDALVDNPEAQADAIPQLRGLIERIVLTPRAEPETGLAIAITGHLANIILLAGGGTPKASNVGNDGAGEVNHALPSFLKIAV